MLLNDYFLTFQYWHHRGNILAGNLKSSLPSHFGRLVNSWSSPQVMMLLPMLWASRTTRCRLTGRWRLGDRCAGIPGHTHTWWPCRSSSRDRPRGWRWRVQLPAEVGIETLQGTKNKVQNIEILKFEFSNKVISDCLNVLTENPFSNNSIYKSNLYLFSILFILIEIGLFKTKRSN